MTADETIEIELDDGGSVSLKIVSEQNATISKLEERDANKYQEASVQIIEGYSYEYSLPEGYSLSFAGGGIVRPSKLNSSAGRIVPNTYVGTVPLDICNKDGEKCGQFELEVRSVKTDYRTEYRLMLEEITELCTDLLMQYTSPANQPFTIDHNEDSRTLYQRFAFLKSVLESDEFLAAVHRITVNPVTSWEQVEEVRDIRSVRKMNRHVIRQMAGASNRVPLPESHSLNRLMDSVPRKVINRGKTDTVDTPENRFIKYALETFKNICGDFKSASKENSRLHTESKLLEEELEEILNHSLFQKIYRPDTLPLNSPILQRKEGYREVLRVWLMINLAARLTWEGGEYVYEGGKRNVATLYEYWLFFKLLEILEDIFSINALSPDKLIEETNDKLGLKLRQGRYLPLKGIFESETRKLNVQFSFNKTFSGGKEYPNAGSWTRSMRPDYTLSVWPYGISAKEAEEEELIVHLHFDAKYKIDRLTDLFGKSDEDLNEEKEEENKGNYKRADLLKMHSYRDSIRRTAGAYILYPGGDKPKKWRGFHEIVPGLGAFTMRPNKKDDGSSDLKKFLKDVLNHFLNRTSQRENYSYQTYRTFETKKDEEVNELLPEPYGENRSLIPNDTFILIGYYRGRKHLDWILESGLYNARAGTARGSLRLGRGEAEAEFLLLHSEGELVTDKIFQIQEKGPRILSRSDLIKKDYYKSPNHDFYLVYRVKQLEYKELKGFYWDIRNLSGYKTGRASGLPFTATLAELMKSKVDR